MAQASGSPQITTRRRVRHSTPPIFALSHKGRRIASSRNLTVKQHVARPGVYKLVNGHSNQNHQQDGTPTAVKLEEPTRHASPETMRSSSAGGPGIAQGPGPSPGPGPGPGPGPQPSPGSGRADEVTEPLLFDGKPFLWEPNIENTVLMNSTNRIVADFLVFKVLQHPNLEEVIGRGVNFEIEAKLGTIIDRATNERVYYPIRHGECVMSEEARVAFRSSMNENQHRELNNWLNHQVQASHHRNPRAASRLEVKYKHRREIDRFYELPSQLYGRLPYCVSSLLQTKAPLKVRITYEQQTNEVLAKIVKARIADLHVHMPHMPLDCRISINFEWDWDGPVEEILGNQLPNKERPPDRCKDRLSYTHGYYQVDLTQVTQTGAAAPPGHKEHELEIELDSKTLLQHGRLLMQGQPSKWEQLVDGLVDNIRVAARRCPPSPDM
jgi:hypothetical protein